MSDVPSDLDPPDPGEAAAIDAITALTVATVRRHAPPGTLARRDAHPKHHAIVRASFAVRDDVPEVLRHGLFAEPRVYPAWIRFSNGSPAIQPDAKRDQRGMAIKLLEVSGEKLLPDERDAPTHDFVLASCPRFFIRDVASYVAFTRAATRKPAIRILGYFFGAAPWRWRWHEFRALTGSLHAADDLLRLGYWSQTPYRLGPEVVKYAVRPIDPPPPAARSGSPDFLRDRLRARLAAAPAAFEFLVQRRTVPTMSVEDSTIEWDETIAPFTPVATIHIPVQAFDSPAQMWFAEQVSYTPWHALPAHEPLGGMNRTRRAVYEAVSRVRHELNGVPRREPHSLELDPTVTGGPPPEA